MLGESNLQIYTILKQRQEIALWSKRESNLQIYTILKRGGFMEPMIYGESNLQIYTILKPQMSGNKCPIRIINLQVPILLYNPA